jgi:hypothetical protein
VHGFELNPEVGYDEIKGCKTNAKGEVVQGSAIDVTVKFTHFCRQPNAVLVYARERGGGTGVGPLPQVRVPLFLGIVIMLAVPPSRTATASTICLRRSALALSHRGVYVVQRAVVVVPCVRCGR